MRRSVCGVGDEVDAGVDVARTVSWDAANVSVAVG
jgi:hypothetical protein